MAMKIEKLLEDAFGFKFTKRSTGIPYKQYEINRQEKEYDILLHLGTGKIRRLNQPAEEKLIELVKNYKVLITDGGETERFKNYKSKFISEKNFTFRLYSSLEEMYVDALLSKIVLCYDGGQAHFLGQFARCLVMVGSLKLQQWAPYDFTEYKLHKKWSNGTESYISQGKMKHIAMNFPMWCSPCFNVGCEQRPCINNILPEQVMEILSEVL
jgi:hypothetical protein